MNAILEAMEKRRSIRKYKPDMVPQEAIDQVIRAGLFAASGMNRQDTIIVAVTNKDVRDRLSKANAEIMGVQSDPFYGAPVVLVVLGNKAMPTEVYDSSLAIGNMMLAAYSLGLGSCWIHRAREEFEKPEWKQFLKDQKIEGDWEGIGHVILGYADGDAPKAHERKPGRVFYVK